MSRWTKPRSYSLKVPWPLAGCVDAGLGRRFSPSALRMRQMLSRLRCAHEMGDDKRQVIEREVGNATQRADNGALLLGCLPGQLVWPGRVVQAICSTALAPLADGLGGDAIALARTPVRSGEPAISARVGGVVRAFGWICSIAQTSLCRLGSDLQTGRHT